MIATGGPRLSSDRLPVHELPLTALACALLLAAIFRFGHRDLAPAMLADHWFDCWWFAFVAYPMAILPYASWGMGGGQRMLDLFRAHRRAYLVAVAVCGMAWGTIHELDWDRLIPVNRGGFSHGDLLAYASGIAIGYGACWVRLRALRGRVPSSAAWGSGRWR